MRHFHISLIFFALILTVFPAVLFAQSNECLERGEGWFTIPDEFLLPRLENVAYQIDGKVVEEGVELPLSVFSEGYTHTVFWNQNEYPFMLQLYRGMPGSALFLAELFLSDKSPKQINLSNVIQEEGEYFFVIFQKELATTYVISENDISPNGNGDMIVPPGTVIPIGDIPVVDGGPTPNEINEYGHVWYQHYFETHELLWCGSESDDTSTVPLLSWDIVSFSVSAQSENNVPTLSYATSTIYADGGIDRVKGVADEDAFTFGVVYTDAENDAPAYVRAWVKGETDSDTFLNMTPASESEAGATAPANPTLLDGDYTNGELFIATSTFPKDAYTYTFLTAEKDENGQVGEEQSFPALSPEESGLTFRAGYSSVAFLPGIGGSRLYLEKGEGEMVWEPNDLNDINEIAIDPDAGTSENPNIAVKGLTDEIMLRLDAWPMTNVYKSFIQYMDKEVVGKNLIAEWKPLAYDWRLGFDELLSHGKLIGTDDGTDIVLFSQTSDTPYLIAELERMAEASDSGKVTILTHSNGGLLAKYLLAELEESNNPLLESIDDVILVASPQLGTPEAVATLLHGTTRAGKAQERDAAENMNSAYHLLPSFAYTETIPDPILTFTDEVDSIPELIDFVGATIGGSDSYAAFLDFLTGHDGTWTEPEDIDVPNVLKDDQLAYAQRTHAVIDNWTPPEHIDVIQIAGFGLNTTYAIEYDDWDMPFVNQTLETLDRTLLKTSYGDGTVVLPSAIAMEDVDGVETFYLDLESQHASGTFSSNRNRKHASILEVQELKDFLANIFTGSRNLEEFIYETSPFSSETSTIHITMHSPVNIHAEVNGLHTGIVQETEDNGIRYYEEEIPNSSYSEWNETKEIILPYGENITLSLEGYAEGTFTLEIEEKEGDDTLAYTVFTDVPVADGSMGDITFHSIDDVTELAFDTDGDGNPDEYAFTDDEVSYDTLRAMIEESEMSEIQTKLFLKQIDVVEKLHERGNVSAAKAALTALQKQIENISCTKVTQKRGKKVCIQEESVLRISAMIDALVKDLEQLVKEKKKKVKEKAKSWLEQLKEKLKR